MDLPRFVSGYHPAGGGARAPLAIFAFATSQAKPMIGLLDCNLGNSLHHGRLFVELKACVYLSNATIHGRFALRACFVNHRTKPNDVPAIVSEVIAAADEPNR
jgi:hypothetical protein